ncbi:MAG: hybrid sensor histidine kinase/response regulator [Timaviella obliquedivisa GSE-PSE-MK23-08B]|jgi:signal transduction histidine kinase/CheY-like chemotaxis protein|nr:hybrid sensor histidine kinase/response regulator [Timaviella obliquedivisa GSE-PSE-MK23-08B]
METVSLKEFILSVPTCIETDDLASVWQRLGQMGCDQAIVLNEQQAPLGILRLSRLIPYLSLTKSWVDDALAAQTIQQICRSLGQDRQPLLEDLTPLSLQWSLEDFRPHFSEIERRQWALVDGLGRYVGILDRLQLLQFMTCVAENSHAPLNQRRVAPLPIALSINPMVELLERLPIPLMLQTASGRMVAQNLAWRQQIGQLRDPEQISQQAGQILEEATVNNTSTSNTSTGNTAEPADNTYPSIWENLEPLSGTALNGITLDERELDRTGRSVGSCLGTEPDTCVCICPMKDGQDRVWQFVKIPMGSASEFKLATLDFSADANGRFAAGQVALSQADSLWLVLAQDTTDQQQIVKELAAKNADLVQLNRLKDEFLSCISHELKTPLTAVLGLSSLLKDQALGKLNERQSRYALLIHRSGRHLISIVNNILDLTRIETGQMELMPEPLNLKTVCQQAFQLVQQLQAAEEEVEAEVLVGASEGKTQFNLEIQPGLESLVADDLRLRQMLANLLSNALKFTAADGKMGLKVEAWEGWLAFTVWDQGIGIPADKQHLIFQKFQQLENPLIRQFKGTGLGLVLTQKLARLHGGDVTFTSVEGRGSEFTLLLPPSPPAPQQIGAEIGTGTRQPSPIDLGMNSGTVSTTAHNRLVMIVEATPHLLDELTHQVVGLGYRVAIARSGTEALEKIRRLQPCVVFLNPVLPMLSGWDVLTLLKADEETRQIPVVATAMRIDQKQSYQNGADSFLSLPVQADSLQRCLEQVVKPLLSEPLPIQLSLTILHLYESQTTPGLISADLTRLLHPHQCRILEVDDLEQADLLARVWKPDIVLLDGACSDPQSYLERFSRSPFLSALPVVTLTAQMTEAANQILGLAVFPCLASTPNQPIEVGSPEVSALLQVMQMAVGIAWTPQILIFDLPTPGLEHSPAPQSVRALMQYLQIAGFQSAIAASWQDVIQSLQNQSIDLLLLCGDPAVAQGQLVEMERSLTPLEAKPPILFWNYQTHRAELDPFAQSTVEQVWGNRTEVIPGSLPMPELLARVNQVLKR